MNAKVILAKELTKEISDMHPACRYRAFAAIEHLRRILTLARIPDLPRKVIETEIDGVTIDFARFANDELVVLVVDVANDDETNVIQLESHARFRARQTMVSTQTKLRASQHD